MNENCNEKSHCTNEDNDRTSYLCRVRDLHLGSDDAGFNSRQELENLKSVSMLCCLLMMIWPSVILGLGTKFWDHATPPDLTYDDGL